MHTRRYQHLVQLLGRWKTTPPFTAAARKDKTAAKYVKQAKEKADKRLRKADDDVERLHRARKAEKRLRYAAELAEPADGHMKAVARKAKKLQTLLGEHQDALVAANFSPRSVLRPTGRTAKVVHLRNSRGQRAKPCSRDQRVTKEVTAQPFPRQGGAAIPPTIKARPGARHRSWDVIAVTLAAS